MRKTLLLIISLLYFTLPCFSEGLLKYNYDEGFGDYYHVFHDSREPIVKWDKSLLTVAIDEKISLENKEIILIQVAEWGKYVNLQVVNDKDKSDIAFVLDSEGKLIRTNPLETGVGALARRNYDTGTNITEWANIYIAPQHKSLSELAYYVAHELGHVFGLPHSDSNVDLMYGTTIFKKYWVNNSQGAYLNRIELPKYINAPTKRDLNTLWKIYNTQR